MTNIPQDPFVLLRSLNPIDESALPVTAEYPPARQTLDYIRLAAAVRKSPKRKVVWATAALAAVSLVATAAAIIVTRHASNPVGVVCFAQPDIDGARAGLSPTMPTAIETCAQAWRDGRLGLPPQPAPPLVGCVLESGVVGVFPSDDPMLCDRLGLVRHDPTQRFDTDPAVLLVERLAERYLAQGCSGAKSTEGFVHDQLAQLGVTNWTVKPPDNPSADRCYTGDVDAKAHTVRIVRAPTPATTSTR